MTVTYVTITHNIILYSSSKFKIKKSKSKSKNKKKQKIKIKERENKSKPSLLFTALTNHLYPVVLLSR